MATVVGVIKRHRNGETESLMLPLRSIFLAIALIGAGLGLFRASWQNGSSNHDLLLGVYLIVVATCAVAAIPKAACCRAGFIGATLFGLAYLICAMQAGFGLETIYDARALAKNVRIGLAEIGGGVSCFPISRFPRLAQSVKIWGGED